MQIITTTGARILFSVPFFVFGLMHLAMGPMMVGMVPHFLPGALYLVYLTGVCMIAAAISIVTKKQAVLACQLLALLLLIYIVTIHIPGLMVPATKQMTLIMMLKDIGLMGGALAFAGIFESERA